MVDPSSDAAVRSIVARLRGETGFEPTAVGVAVALIGAIAMLALRPASRPIARSQSSRTTVTHVRRSSRLSAEDWVTLKNAIRVRTMALSQGRTSGYRSFAAFLGLSDLIGLHPIQPGPCATAISYLYDNLLDLRHAYPGEDWRPLRRLIATQPRLSVCAPKATPRVTYAD